LCKALNEWLKLEILGNFALKSDCTLHNHFLLETVQHTGDLIVTVNQEMFPAKKEKHLNFEL